MKTGHSHQEPWPRPHPRPAPLVKHSEWEVTVSDFVSPVQGVWLPCGLSETAGVAGF